MLLARHGPSHSTQGFDGFLASKENLRKRGRSYKPEDRLFALSSRTSPAVRALVFGSVQAGCMKAGSHPCMSVLAVAVGKQVRDGMDAAMMDGDASKKLMTGGTFGQKGYPTKQAFPSKQAKR